MFIRSWIISAIKHIGAGLGHGCLQPFRRRQKVTYRQIRYGSEDLSYLCFINVANHIE